VSTPPTDVTVRELVEAARERVGRGWGDVPVAEAVGCRAARRARARAERERPKE
jgi:hypothetical protein